MIKQFDLSGQYKVLRKEINKQLRKVFSSGMFCMGEQVKEFEENFAKYIGTKYAIGVNSGSAALTLSLEALGIGPDDEVIVPANTYIATAFAVSHVGATPIFVDNDNFYHLSIEDLCNKITDSTRAIIPVHLYGLPMNMDAIRAIAKTYNLLVIEDCAQAAGATFKNKKVGVFGDVGCYSFYPAKNLGASGDGGIVVTDNEEIKEKVTKLKDDGRVAKYEHQCIGYNERLDTIHAAVLNIKLKYLDEWNKQRRKISYLYTKAIEEKNLPITIPKEKLDCYHVYHQYVIRINNRDKVRKALWDKYKIGTGIHYPIPVHKQEAYKDFNSIKCPVAEDNANKLLSLPMYPELPLASALEVIDKLEKVIEEEKINK
jgi:dTDP-4-amino-4,6-dideoxygalactose transaminase